MNQRHHDDHPDLPDLLEAIGASAEEEAGFSTLSDDAMVSSVRVRATALRVRRARTRSLAAVATVAAVAAAGVGVTQYVGRVAPSPVPPAQTTPAVPAAFPACGAPVRQAPEPGAVRLVTATGAPTATEIPSMSIYNDSGKDLQVGSSGWVGYVVARAGVVVGSTTSMPAPYRQDLLSAGETSQPLLSAPPSMCDGTPLDTDDPFEVYAYLDAETAPSTLDRLASSSTGWGTGTRVQLWSEAVPILPASTGTVPGAQDDTTFSCGTAPVATHDPDKPFRLAAQAGDPLVVDRQDVIDGSWYTSVTVTNSSSDTTYRANVSTIRGVLVSDGHVVGAPVDFFDDALGEQVDLVELSARGGAERPARVRVTGCSDGANLPAGTYQLWGVVDMTLKEGTRENVGSWSPAGEVRVVAKIGDVVLD